MIANTPPPGYKECPACAEPIRENAKLCRFCGTLLTDEPLPPRHNQEPSFTYEGEYDASIQQQFASSGILISPSHRKRISEFLRSSEDQYRSATVMFADITGFSKLCQKLKYEHVEQILDAYYRILLQTVDFYNGFVVEFAGDGGLAVFGAPLAYERDAEGCVRAAIEVRKRMHSLPPFQGNRIDLSIGIATGEILSTIVRTVYPPRYKVFGQAINLASRLESIARSGEVLVDGSTHELVKNLFDTQSAGSHELKNIPEPVSTHRIVSELKPDAVRRDFTVPFVGRDKEIAVLEKVWEAFIADPNASSPHGVIVHGEPGIGKTRMIKEWMERKQGPETTVAVEMSPFDTKVSWSLWRAILLALMKTSSFNPIVDEQKWWDYLEKYHLGEADDNSLGLVLGIGDTISAFSALSPHQIRRMLRADLTTLLRRVAEKQQLVLKLDDLQWADPSSLSLLREVLLEQRVPNIFPIILHRSEFEMPGEGWKKLPSLRVQPLGAEQRETLFATLIDVSTVVPDIKSALSRRAAGNPLYLLELVRMLRTHGEQPSATSPDGKQLLPENLSEWVPASLREMLQSRMDMLDKRRRSVLDCGAILGRRFSLHIIELFEHVREGILGQLYSLRTLEFLDDLPMPDGVDFEFHHELTREVAYRSMLERVRRQLHHTAAFAIEGKFGHRLRELAPMLAYHFRLAEEFEKALEYSTKAGAAALGVGAVVEALTHYEDALELVDKLPESEEATEKRVCLLRERGRLLRFAGRNEEAIESFTQALSSCPDSANQALRVALQFEIGLTETQIGNHQAAEKRLRRATRQAANLNDPPLVAMLANARGICAWHRGDYRSAGSAYRETADLRLDRSHPSVAGDAANNIALIDWKEGRLADALKGFRHALRLRRKSGDRFGAVATVMNIGIIQESTGQLAGAEKSYASALEEAHALHFAQAEAAIHGNLSNLALIRGDYPHAQRSAAESLSIAKRIGDRRAAAIALENLALANTSLKEADQARQCIDDAREIAEEINDAERLLSLDLTQLELDISTGLNGLAKRFSTAMKTIASRKFESERPRLIRLQALAAINEGKTAQAKKHLEKGVELAEKQGQRAESKLLKSIRKKARI